ncbi:DUF317 domain-containing protein [Streptomyces stelliscabiei]|uniref:DUF317 domain-containing protein n=1 Tax=Streptomyces stelliscabiei TaxID=146820 RepID=A0A8I0P974_9ACTN|nr:DUF317 domain-containing protein [Streptomyces stelliscabiei]KND28599.1 hypothetical protein IQ64_43475 [Streptomyces stelliscabiei]MBE1599877.1 hypothetical protein [Streptomyces stelliscabiei]
MRRNQWASWGGRRSGGEQAEQHYLIEPRHLAGGGNLGHVTEFLRASGWKDASRSGGSVVFDSPDRTVRIGYDPHTQPGGWTISGHATGTAPAWHATLGRRTPVEVVAGVTDALTQPRAAHAPNAWALLEQQGWTSERGEDQSYEAVHPDNNSWLRYCQDERGQAVWWAGARTEHGQVWDAVFTPTTPLHLIEAFATALADPQPVMRPRGHVPPTSRVRTTSVSVLPSQLTAWQQARVAAARAATWARFATTHPRNQRRAAGPHATAAGQRR